MSVPSWALPYLDRINGTGFDFLRNMDNPIWDDGQHLYSSAPDTISWYTNYGITGDWGFNNFLRSTGNAIKVSSSNTIDKLYITGSDETGWECPVFCSAFALMVNNFYFIQGFNNVRSNIQFWSGNGFKDNAVTGNNMWTNSTFRTETLELMLTNIGNFCRNVEIYVNGELWDLPSPEWRSVPSVSGKLGDFLLSTIAPDELNDGNAVSGADGSQFTRLINETRLSQLGANVPFNTETPVIYSGSGDIMTYEIVALQASGQPILIDSYKIRFYISGIYAPFYTWTLTGGIHAPENTWLHFIIDEVTERARLSLIVRNSSSSPVTYSYNSQSFTDAQASIMYSWLHAHIPPEDREDSTDNITNGDEGGGTWQPWNNVSIPKTGNPTKNALTIGFTTMYKVDETILKDLSDFLWSDNFLDNVKKFFSDPREIIVGLMLFPIAPSASSLTSEIKAGSIQTGVMAYKLLDQYLTIDMGYIDMHEETSTFLDYPPNTKAIVYLPYCGEHYLDVNEIMNKQLHLEYTFDFLTGAVCANISVDGNYVYSFTGQCGIQIPTSSEDFGRMYSSVLSAGATLGTAMATLATGGMTAPLMFGMGANMLSNGMSMTPDIQYSSGGGGASGFIANQTPYLRLELPVPLMANGDTSDTDFEATKQYAFIGKPAYQSLTLSSCSGYTKCLDAHLKNIPATEIELAGILRDLKEGVIIQEGNEDPSDTPTVSGNTVITFIKCKSAPNVIGKTWDTNETEAIEGKIVYNQSISKPQFIIKGNIKGYNYCYIGMFSRYYYITDIVYAENGMQEISMSVDALQSFRTEILTCKAIVERQKKKGNLYMTDSYMYTKANKKIVTVPFMGGDNQYINQSGMQTFERQNNTYVLTIAGD